MGPSIPSRVFVSAETVRIFLQTHAISGFPAPEQSAASAVSLALDYIGVHHQDYTGFAYLEGLDWRVDLFRKKLYSSEKLEPQRGLS